MEEFPFTESEWATVSEATLSVVNAVLADDATLRASHYINLLDVLAGLRVRHGDHPVLLETEADFADDDGERLNLYRRAICLAATHELPTLSIRLSLARTLSALGRSTEAAAELSACADELPNGDDADRASWSELVAELSQAEPTAAPDRKGE